MARVCAECLKKISFLDQGYSDPSYPGSQFCSQEHANAFTGKPRGKNQDSPTAEDEFSAQSIQRRETEERIALEKMKDEKGVYVKGITMPFEEMVVFILKWTLASIPAGIVISLVVFIILSILSAI